nr:MAG TPA_asm: hypothetical protein [Caudoviricetes sp.]
MSDYHLIPPVFPGVRTLKKPARLIVFLRWDDNSYEYH